MVIAYTESSPHRLGLLSSCKTNSVNFFASALINELSIGFLTRVQWSICNLFLCHYEGCFLLYSVIFVRIRLRLKSLL